MLEGSLMHRVTPTRGIAIVVAYPRVENEYVVRDSFAKVANELIHR